LLFTTITARGVNDAWDQAKQLLNKRHVVRPSRVGEVWEYGAPVVTEYLRPTERVLFNPLRNANPFFHIFEGLWMLAGREDVAWISQFNARMKEFSDDGVIFHGAYGYRWRYAFDLDGGAEDDYADQLVKIVRMLKKSPDERRAVLAMWNPIWDLERPDVKDVPCNTQAYFKVREGALTMTVCCRSNDIVWGAYGANAVHTSMLQEYMAAMIGIPVGAYYQISDSWHAYTERWEEFGGNDPTPTRDLYAEDCVRPYPLVTVPDAWDAELKLWMVGSETGEEFGDYKNSFFQFVAQPLLLSWQAYKANNLRDAQHHAARCAATDWRQAALDWLGRIEARRAARGKR
jgi:hypothetical protein